MPTPRLLFDWNVDRDGLPAVRAAVSGWHRVTPFVSCNQQATCTHWNTVRSRFS
jgi:hypothetical protein